jgi:hypothetical protein
MTNNSGERGSPCLTPLRRMAEVPELKIDSIHCIHFWLKPLCSMIFIIVGCSIILYILKFFYSPHVACGATC